MKQTLQTLVLASTAMLTACTNEQIVKPCNTQLTTLEEINFPDETQIPGVSLVEYYPTPNANRTIVVYLQDGHYSDFIADNKNALARTSYAQNIIGSIVEFVADNIHDPSFGIMQVHRELLIDEQHSSLDERLQILQHLITEVLIENPDPQYAAKKNIFTKGKGPNETDLSHELVNLRYATLLGYVGKLHLDGKIQLMPGTDKETYDRYLNSMPTVIPAGAPPRKIRHDPFDLFKDREWKQLELIEKYDSPEANPVKHIFWGDMHAHSFVETMREFNACSPNTYQMVLVHPEQFWNDTQ